MAKIKMGSKEDVVYRKSGTAEAREMQMIALAEDLAEKQLRAGTASSSVIVHYLNLATERQKYEIERLKSETELAKAKISALESAQNMDAMYKEAIEAMKLYTGGESEKDEVL